MKRGYVAGEPLTLTLNSRGAAFAECVCGADGEQIDDILQLEIRVLAETSPRSFTVAVKTRRIGPTGFVDTDAGVSSASVTWSDR